MSARDTSERPAFPITPRCARQRIDIARSEMEKPSIATRMSSVLHQSLPTRVAFKGGFQNGEQLPREISRISPRDQCSFGKRYS